MTVPEKKEIVMRSHATIASASVLLIASASVSHASDDPSATPGPVSAPARTAAPETIQVKGHAPTGEQGQSVHPNQNTSGDQTSKFVSLPTSPPPHIGLFPEFGETLLDDGIDFHGIAFDHFLANPTAGVNHGKTINLGALRPAVDLDLGKLAGIPGGNIHFAMTFFGLRSDLPQAITQTGGVLTGFQTTPATQTAIVSVLTYEQRLLNDRLSIQFGRTNAYNYFLLPNSLDPFTHYSSTFQVTGDFASQPYPVWGGVATYKLSPAYYVQGGLFEDNYRYTTNYGDRFGDSESTGVQAIGEIGHRNDFTTARYPSNFEAGIEWNTRHGEQDSNLKGTGAPSIPFLQAANFAGGGVLFLQGLQTMWRGAKPAYGPPPNIALYGSLDVAVDKPQPIDLDTMIGLNFTGLIPGRPLDALGIQARYQRLSQVEADQETFRETVFSVLQHHFSDLGSTQPRDGWAYEAVGNIQVTPAIAFRPLVEYFVHPDGYYPPSATRPGRPTSGFEAGFFAVVSIGRLLGTSLKPF